MSERLQHAADAPGTGVAPEQGNGAGKGDRQAAPPPQATANGQAHADSAPAGRSPVRLATWNLLSAQLYTLVTLAVGLVSTPLLLRWLGADRFGLLRVLEVWTTYLGIPSYCTVLASSIRLVPLLGQGDYRRINALLAAAGLGLLLLAAISSVVALGIAVGLPWLIRPPVSLVNECWWAFVLGTVAFWLAPLSLTRALLEADQRGYLVNLALLGQSLCAVGLTLTAARLGWGLPGQALASLLAVGLQLALMASWARRRYGWLAPWRTQWADVRMLGSVMLGLLALGALGTIASRLEQVCVNYFAGPAALTGYLLTQRLFVIGQSQLLAIGNAVWVPLTDLYHTGRSERFAQRVRDCQLLLCGLAYAGGLALLGHVRHFVHFWVGEEHYCGDAMVFAFCLGLPVIALQSFHGWLLTATGHTREFLPGVAVHCLGLLVACGVLGGQLGAAGVAWGVLGAGGAVLLPWDLHLLHRKLQLPWPDLLSPYWSTTLLALPLGLAAWCLGRAHTPPGWLGLAGEMTGVGLLYLGLWWWLILTDRERSEYKWLVRLVLNRSIGTGH